MIKGYKAKKPFDGLTVPGHDGKWYETSRAQFRQFVLLLVESETFGDDAPSVILVMLTGVRSSVVLEDVENGFAQLNDELGTDDEVERFIAEIVRRTP